MSQPSHASHSWHEHLVIVLAGGLAGGLGWGIRGQYGHESGAMIAGLLVSCVIAVGYLGHLPSLSIARAMALATIGIGVGGSMTYGQTVGLTHDPNLVGNWEALRWGMLGLAIKGSIWIGFSGLLLGMGLSGRLLSPLKLIGMLLAMLVLQLAGYWLFNEPFEPARRLLPDLYFSADWYWQPGASLKPRREVWGGLALALIVPAIWLRLFASDRLAYRMTLWGMLGGGLGFPAGQALQAYHAWNRAAFQTGFWKELDPLMNWWNVMETTFGCIMGVCLTLGIALNRRLIEVAPVANEPSLKSQKELLRSDPQPLAHYALPESLRTLLEFLLMTIHVVLLADAELFRGGWYADGLTMLAIPLIGISFGRYWPYFLLLPITLLPIAGKTYRQMVIKEPTVAPAVGALLFLILPLMLSIWLAWFWSRKKHQALPASSFAPWMLLLSVWIYFSLNFAFFQFPFPWAKWTARTPNALFYSFAAIALSVLAMSRISTERRSALIPNWMCPRA